MDNKKKTIGIISIVVIFLFLGGLYIFKGQDELKNSSNFEEVFQGDEPEKKSNEGEKIPLKETSVIVDIKGEVKNPGVYKLDEGSIVEDLIAKAGGITGEADLKMVNRARLLVNNEAVLIPNKKDVEADIAFNNTSPKVDLNGGGQKDGKININTASVTELDEINGIGPSKAEAIIAYREENGGFKALEDLKNVSGIGDATFEKIKDSICI